MFFFLFFGVFTLICICSLWINLTNYSLSYLRLWVDWVDMFKSALNEINPWSHSLLGNGVWQPLIHPSPTHDFSNVYFHWWKGLGCEVTCLDLRFSSRSIWQVLVAWWILICAFMLCAERPKSLCSLGGQCTATRKMEDKKEKKNIREVFEVSCNTVYRCAGRVRRANVFLARVCWLTSPRACIIADNFVGSRLLFVP